MTAPLYGGSAASPVSSAPDVPSRTSSDYQNPVQDINKSYDDLQDSLTVDNTVLLGNVSNTVAGATDVTSTSYRTLHDPGPSLGTVIEDAGKAVGTAAEWAPSLAAVLVQVFHGISNFQTAPGGESSPLGEKPDYTKGLFVQQDSIQELDPVDTLYPDELNPGDCKDGSSSAVYYMPLDSEGRAQGVMACLNRNGFNYLTKGGGLAKSDVPDTQIIGSAPLFPPYKAGYEDSVPSGWSLGSGLQRGHLLARQLGGVGNDRRNLVPLYPETNKRNMLDYENKIAAMIEAGRTVYFSARANYSGDNPIPTSIYIWASTADGTIIANATVPNNP